MQINQLIHFVTIVNKQSFTTAANELHIAQPSLSASIKRLENEIGFTLIDRSSRLFKLTAEGRSFLTKRINSLCIIVRLLKRRYTLKLKA